MSETVKITEAAALQIKDMMKQNEEEGSFLRVAVKGGGCSGLSYGMGFVQDAEEGDIQFEQHGLKVVVDKEDAAILNGTVIDFKQSMMGGGLRLRIRMPSPLWLWIIVCPIRKIVFYILQ